MITKEVLDSVITRFLQEPEPIDIQFVSQEAYRDAWKTGELIDSLRRLIEVAIEPPK